MTNRPLYLAPMEDVTDPAFRALCKRYGADRVYTEFVNADALVRDIASTTRKLTIHDVERPVAIQIYGREPEAMADAARIVETAKPDFIDINFGCPVKKVAGKGAGAGLLRDVPKMLAITKAVVNAVQTPVTVKTRLGWEEADKPIVQVAEMLQDVGVQMLSIHGRTRSQMYSGAADWTLIGEVKNNPRITIPIVGNGDIDSGAKAAEYRDRYGVDGVMVGRAAIGNPFVFKEIKNHFAGIATPLPTYEERAATCMEHLRGAVEVKGERTAVLEMRRHYAGYFKGIPNFKEKKVRLMLALTVAECEAILK